MSAWGWLGASGSGIEPTKYAYCERVTAGPTSPHHIRELTPVGMKRGGGADTGALCGAEVAWDTSEVGADDDVMSLSEPRPVPDGRWRACRPCAERYVERTKPTGAGSTTLAFLLTLTILCAVAWFAIDNVPGVVEAMTVGVLRILGYTAVGCVGVAISWRWIERAL